MPGTPCNGGPFKPIPERLPSPWDPILPKGHEAARGISSNTTKPTNDA